MLAGGVLGLATLLAASSTPTVTLTRGPYLQRLTTSGVTIVWNTDVPAACSLAIRPFGGTAAIIPGGIDTVCAIPVTGLAPGTQYAYVPRADGVPLAAESVFRTDAPDRPFSFLVVGDSGTVGADQSAVRDRMLKTPADFLLHTGDMVYPDGAAEDFDPKFFWPYRDLMRHLVFWPCLGNHDAHTDGGAPWRAAFYTPANNPAGNENYYSFDFGNAHFVVLNSNASTAWTSSSWGTITTTSALCRCKDVCPIPVRGIRSSSRAPVPSTSRRAGAAGSRAPSRRRTLSPPTRKWVST